MSKLLTKEELAEVRRKCISGDYDDTNTILELLDHVDALYAREINLQNAAADTIGKLELKLRRYEMKEQFDLAYALRKNNA